MNSKDNGLLICIVVCLSFKPLPPSPFSSVRNFKGKGGLLNLCQKGDDAMMLKMVVMMMGMTLVYRNKETRLEAARKTERKKERTMMIVVLIIQFPPPFGHQGT